MATMDIQFNFNKEFTAVTVQGEYNLQDDTSILEKITTNKKLNEHKPLIIDCSHVDFSKITYETMQMATHHNIKEQNLDKFKIAIVTTSPIGFDIISIWYGEESINGDTNTKVFQSLEAAKMWLEL